MNMEGGFSARGSGCEARRWGFAEKERYGEETIPRGNQGVHDNTFGIHTGSKQLACREIG